jgi:hypothetical protein
MPQQFATRVFVLLGYELRNYGEALGIQLAYGKARPAPVGNDKHTPMLVMTADEARTLARDLLEMANTIDAASGSQPPAPPGSPLH